MVSILETLSTFLTRDIIVGVTLRNTLLAILVMAIGALLSRLITRKMREMRSSFGMQEESAITASRLISIAILSTAALVSLALLGLPIVDVSWIALKDLATRIVIIALITIIGSTIVIVLLDLIRDFIMSVGSEHLAEYQISRRLIGFSFMLVKVFSTLLILSAAMRYTGMSFMVFDMLLVASIIILMLSIAFLITYAYKDYAANLIVSPYISKHIVRVGQRVEVDGKVGQVSQITGHATYIAFDSGQSVMIPNSLIIKKPLTLQRVVSDVHRLEPFVSKYTVALPSKSAQASMNMLLACFGYSVDAVRVGEIITHHAQSVKGSNKDVELIASAHAAKELTASDVQGAFITWNPRYDLRAEMQSWLTQEALILLVLPSSLPTQSRDGHTRFVLVVGVEEDELVIMDPVMRTRGTYLISAKRIQAFLEKEDLASGFSVFARKRTPAAWRLSEGLYYGEISAYQSLSKAFERYLRQSMRESKVVNTYLSPYVASQAQAPKSTKKPSWKPNLSSGKEQR